MGTTRKVNIMVDVSEEVYDTIVEPYKRNKKFSKLIETLLLGCMENDGVAEYVESKFSSYYKQANHAFNGAVGSMMSSLAMVGIMADTASEMMEDGKRAVKLDDGVKVINGPSPEKPEEDAKLEKEIKELRRENQDTREKLQEVTEMLMKFMSGEFNSKKEEETVAEKEVAASAVKEESTEETVEEVKAAPEKTDDLRGKTVYDSVEKREEQREEKREEKRVDPKTTEVKAKPMSEDDDDLDEDDPLFAPVSFEDEGSEDDEINLFEDEEKEDEDSYLDSLLNGQVYTV